MKKCTRFKLADFVTRLLLTKHLIMALITSKCAPTLSGVICMYLLMANLTFAQQLSSSLDVKQYPSLVYTPDKIHFSRDLFNVNSDPMNLIVTTDNEQTLISARSNLEITDESLPRQFQVQDQCHKWSKALVYLGTFSSAGEDSAMIRNSESKTLKIKVGEFIADQQLRLQKITLGKLTAANSDSSTCSLKKLTY